MKTKFLMLAIFIFMFFISCDSSSIEESEPAVSPSSVQAKTAVERPVSISLVSTDTPTGATFVGTMTHLGNINGVQVTTVFLDNGDGTYNFESDDVIIAANGDELYSHSNVVITFTSALEATYAGTITFAGGTGRFVGATGYLSVLNGAYIINGDTGIGSATHTANGMIKY